MTTQQPISQPTLPGGLRAACRRLLAGEPRERALTAFCWVWIALLLIPMALMCLYARPLYDDYGHTYSTVLAWAHTGSVLATLREALHKTAYLYQTWQGTYVAMFVSVFTPMVFSDALFFISPLCTLLFMALCLRYFTQAIARHTLSLPRAASLLLYAVALTLWLGCLPGAREAVYWQSGAPYGLGGALLALLGGLLLRLRGPGRRALRTACAVLCGAALGGCPYPLGLGGTVALALLAGWALLARSKARLGAVLAFLATAASLAVVVLAPGNAVRQGQQGAPMQPISAIVMSVAECLQYTGFWLGPLWIAAGLVLAALLWKPLQASGLRFAHPVWVTLLSLGALAAAFVPSIYATGVESIRIDRIQASLYQFFTLLALGNVVYWLGYAATRTQLRAPGLPRWKLLACAALAVWGLFASSIMTMPCVAAPYSLLSGQAARYHAQMTAREQAFADAPSKAEALAQASAITDLPALQRTDGMEVQREPVTLVTHQYYSIQRLIARYGAGHIPQAEWDALDAWN